MPLSAGTRLGAYEIVSALGAGGMGEVYRARDAKLNRDVALKVLPELFACDPDRLARFKREAQVLASLNHPNIAAIYGLEESNGVQALVLELVEGPTLADRVAQGPIPPDEALPMARQIAEALEAAHEQGIIHRDLKPANIKVRPDGAVKVLDFGLAKALEPVEVGRGDVTASPTITSPALTQIGMILGTAAYLSPEQVKGRPADKRSDVWAFGAVLYEMLSGQRAFKGEDISDTLAAVLRQTIDVTGLPASTPAAVRRLVARCLDRDVKRRLRDIGEARIALEDPTAAVFGDAAVTAAAPKWSIRSNRVAWLIAALSTVASIATGVILARRPSHIAPEASVTQFTIQPPVNTSFASPAGPGTGVITQVAVSPDGRNIAFVARAQSVYQIWLRPVGSLGATLLAGTEGGTFPFWSPDSRFVGFFAAGKLKKVAIDGGPPSVLCDAVGGRGGSWSRNNVILFAPMKPAGLLRVSSAGGTPTPVTTVDPATGEEDNHRWPHFLPDGQHFFYTAIRGPCCPAAKTSKIKIGSLDSASAAVTILETESTASFATGHVFFARDETLMAQPFDPDTRQFTGEAFPVAEHVRPEGSRYVGASVSSNGTLVYASDDAVASRQLTWFDRAGRPLSTVGDAGPYSDLALSPDERRVAISVESPSSRNHDIWIMDIERNVPSRVTFDPADDLSPVWSPNSTQIAFEGERSGKMTLRQRLVSGTGTDEPLLEALGTRSRPCESRQCTIVPSAWSADGRYIAYTLAGGFPRTADVWIFPLFGDRKPFPLAETEFLEGSATFSPDGRWVAYTTNEPGWPNVYVQPFLRTGGKYPVSRDGGYQPRWRSDGKELFYLAPDGTIMTVPVDATGEFHAGAPQPLFRMGAVANSYRQQFAVTKDGQRFLVNAPSQQSSGPQLTVVVNWIATIQK